MIRLVRAEWTKLFTTKVWIGLLLGACVMVGGFAALLTAFAGNAESGLPPVGTPAFEQVALVELSAVPPRGSEDGVLTVTGTTPAEVGRRAFAAGVELHELRSHTSGLEEIYFQLTAGSEQFAAPSPTAPVTQEISR